MRKLILTVTLLSLVATSCGSKKKIADLESKNKEVQDLLNSCTVKLNTCLTEKEGLTNQIDFLKKNNSELMNNMNNMNMSRIDFTTPFSIVETS